MDLAIVKLVAFALIMNSSEGVLAKSPDEVDFHFRNIRKMDTLRHLQSNLPSPIIEALENYLSVWGPVSEPALEAPSIPSEHALSDPLTEPNSIKEIKEKLNVRDHSD